MKAVYSKAFVEQALVKIFSRDDRTVVSVANELNMNDYPLKNGIKRGSVSKRNGWATKEKRPQDWSAEEQLLALQESPSLSGEALTAGCREHGVFAHNLPRWKTAFCAESKAAPGNRELWVLKDEHDPLKREWVRKEKTLAEAAALLILQKKFRALGEDKVK